MGIGLTLIQHDLNHICKEPIPNEVTFWSSGGREYLGELFNPLQQELFDPLPCIIMLSDQAAKSAMKERRNLSSNATICKTQPNKQESVQNYIQVNLELNTGSAFLYIYSFVLLMYILKEMKNT